MFLQHPYKLAFKTERLMVLFCLRIYRRTFAWKFAKKFSRPFRADCFCGWPTGGVARLRRALPPAILFKPFRFGRVWSAFLFSSRRYQVAHYVLAPIARSFCNLT